jgi:hypothetical protein
LYHRAAVESCSPSWVPRVEIALAALMLALAPALSCSAGGASGRAEPGRAGGNSAAGGRLDDRRADGAASSSALPRGRAPGALAGGQWELAGKLSSLRKAAPRARSQHLSGDLEAEVLANDEARAYPPLGPQGALPPGAVLVEAHYRAGNADPVVLFAMAKQPPGFDPGGGDWEYLIVEPSGLISERGRLPLCARCHAEAPHDHLFGPLRGPLRGGSAGGSAPYAPDGRYP